MSDENRNSGNWNSGNWNSGFLNSGNLNSGNLNSGNWNSGNLNSGNWNSGNRNSGNWNSGNLNSGNWNSGNLNSGNWNSGNRNSGFFCTETPFASFFDQPTKLTHREAVDLIPWIDLPVGCKWVSEGDMTSEEKTENPNYATIGGYLKVLEKDIRAAFPLAWPKLDDATRQRFLDLPNFCAEKFLAITGVDVRAPEAPEEVEVNGVVYVRK